MRERKNSTLKTEASGSFPFRTILVGAGIAFAVLFLRGGVRCHHLLPLSKYYYSAYGSYGWQIVTDDGMIRQQGQKLSAFIDIYENSYN